MGEINLLVIYIFFVILNILLGIISVKYDSDITKFTLCDIFLHIIFALTSVVGTIVWCATHADCKDTIYNNGKGTSSKKNKFRIR